MNYSVIVEGDSYRDMTVSVFAKTKGGDIRIPTTSEEKYRLLVAYISKGNMCDAVREFRKIQREKLEDNVVYANYGFNMDGKDGNVTVYQRALCFKDAIGENIGWRIFCYKNTKQSLLIREPELLFKHGVRLSLDNPVKLKCDKPNISDLIDKRNERSFW